MRSAPSVGPSPSGESAAPGPAGMPFVGATAWKPWRVMVAFVAAVGLVLLGRVIVSGNGAGPLVGIAIALSLLNVAPVALALLLASLDGRPTAHDFGLRRAPLGRAVALLFAVGIGLTVLSVLWVEALGLDAEESQALTDRLGTDGTLQVLILVVILTVLGPLGEEFLFRGYIFGALRNWRGVWPAALAASVLFAATHIGWLPIALLVPTALFGIAMCLLYHWTGSLYPCIAGHAINNSIPLGAALDWTWQTPALIVGSTLAALTIARLIALRLERRHLAPGTDRARTAGDELMTDGPIGPAATTAESAGFGARRQAVLMKPKIC